VRAKISPGRKRCYNRYMANQRHSFY